MNCATPISRPSRTSGARQEEHEASGQDAVADLTIYLWGVISHYAGEDLGEFIVDMQDVDVPWVSDPEDALFELGASVGRLAAYHVTPELCRYRVA